MISRISNKMSRFAFNSINYSSDSNLYNFKSLKVTQPNDFVFHVQFNNPSKRNSMNEEFWMEIKKCFDLLKFDENCRCVLISGAGTCFSSGIDLAIFSKMVSEIETQDPARRAFLVRRLIVKFQDSFASIERCLKPVIAAIHGPCIGGALNLICHTDIRIAASNAWFQLKEIDIGLAADVGALQRLPRLIGSDSLVRELVYTARRMAAEEAKSCGLISELIPESGASENGGSEGVVARGLELASNIASKSPVAVQSSKAALIYARDNPNALHAERMQADWNQVMLQSEDLIKAVMAQVTKEKAQFAKL